MGRPASLLHAEIARRLGFARDGYLIDVQTKLAAMPMLHQLHPDAPPARALRGQLYAELFIHDSHRPPRHDEVEAYLRANPSTHLVAPLGTFVVALLHDQAVGCAGLRHYGNDIPVDAAEIKRMFVQPHARGHGIASLLLDHLVDIARATGHQRLVLDTRDELISAIKLYQRYGFTQIAPYNTNVIATSWWEKSISS